MALTPQTLVGIEVIASATQALAMFKGLKSEVDSFKKEASKTNLTLRGMDRLWSIIALGSGAALIKTFVGMSAELQKVQFQILAFERDLKKIPPIMDSILTLVRKVPFSLNTMTTAFVRLKASGIDPITDATTGEGPLKALADAVAAFGGADEIFKRATIAIQQMAGKGVISMEELRQQLGEAIPVAMRVMAAQMGISVARLIRDVSRGTIEFQTGFDALIKGFQASFTGAAELIKTSFLGQLQESVQLFQILAKTLIQDTGALDLFTASVQLFNQKLSDFIDFLSSPKGQAAVGEFVDKLEDIAIFAAKASVPIQSFVKIIASFSSVIANAISLLPPEVIGGGLLGFILFGRAGIGVGAIFGFFNEEISAVSIGIAKFVDNSINLIKSKGLEDVATRGLIGFLLFGKTGALIGISTTIFQQLGDLASTTANKISESFAVTGAVLTSIPDLILGDFEKVAAKLEKVRSDFRSAISGEGLFEIPEEIQGTPAESFVRKLLAELETLKQGIIQKREELTKNLKPIADIGGLLPTQITEFERLLKVLSSLEEKAAGAGSSLKRFLADTQGDINKLNDILRITESRLSKLPDDAKPSFVAGFEDTIKVLKSTIGEFLAVRDEIASTISEQFIQKMTLQITSINEQFDAVISQDAGLGKLNVALQKVEASYTRTTIRIQSMINEVKKFLPEGELQAALLSLLNDLMKKGNNAFEAQNRLTTEAINLQNQLESIQLKAIVRRAEANFQISQENAQLKFLVDEVLIAGIRARQQILDTVDSLTIAIANQTAKMKEADDINKEVFRNSIADLKRVRDATIESMDEVIEQAKFAASDYGKFVGAIAQTVEDAIVSGFDALINRTKTAKQVLLDFYRAITAAAIRFIVQQFIIDQLFGFIKASGIGNFKGVLRGGFDTPLPTPGTGTVGPKAASGLSFMVGGTGSTDSRQVSFNATPGEEVTVRTPGQQRMQNIGPQTIIIQAIDADSIRRLFMKHGDILVQSLNNRLQLNRGR